MSVPSRDLIDSIGKSTASMVPRMRTVGGCCAQASVANRAARPSETASIRGHEEDFSMVFLPRCIWRPTQRKQRTGAAIQGGDFTSRRVHIGGVKLSPPTLPRLVSSEPSGGFVMQAITF